MPFPNLNVPNFANVPFVSGVPAILRSPEFPPTPDPEAASSDGATAGNDSAAPQWGIYDQDGKSVLVADTVLGVDFVNESRISDFPVEKGAFASYDKVSTPYDARVIFACGGDDLKRSVFLETLAYLERVLDLFDVVTPQKVYTSANVIHYDYRRQARSGATMLTVEVWLREVRIAPAAAFTQSGPATNVLAADVPAPPTTMEATKSPNATAPKPIGNVQAGKVPPRVLKSEAEIRREIDALIK